VDRSAIQRLYVQALYRGAIYDYVNLALSKESPPLLNCPRRGCLLFSGELKPLVCEGQKNLGEGNHGC